ncbi:MAG: hypothetical protein Q9160_001357 [Pyrenula sp. 1 TL-2023]
MNSVLELVLLARAISTMAEAFAVVGFASALLHLVDFGTKVIRRLREVEDYTVEGAAYFKSVRTRFPLILDLVKKIMLQMEAGIISDKSQEVMHPIVNSCIAQAQNLDKMISRSLPLSTDNFWIRGKKVVHGVWSESEIQRIDAALKSDFELLVQACTFQKSQWTGHSNAISFAPTFSISPSVQVTLAQQQNQLPSMPWEEPERQVHAPQAVFMVPFSRDPNFLGRQDVIKEVSEKFQKCLSVTLSGLGGIGKSQIAIEFCFVFKDMYPSAQVFWVYGADPVHFEQSYQEIAKKLRVPGWNDLKTDKLRLVQEWLQDESATEWLMIVDNADDATMFYGTRLGDSSALQSDSKSLARFLPQSSRGRVLITTRDRRLGERLSQGPGIIQVAPLSAGESKDLLRSKTSEENWSEDDALKLVEYLSSLPLAITQAAAFISENSVTVSEYLEMLCNDENDLKELLNEHLEDSRRDWRSENSVIRTWKLSFEQISKESPRAAEILSQLATLNFYEVSRSYLRKDDEIEMAFRTALGTLQAFSLITVTRGQNATCKMHRLVALATQKWLEVRGTLEYWQSRALNTVTRRFPGPGHQHYSEFTNMLRLMPHAQVVLGYQLKSTDDILACARLLISTALFDLHRAEYQQAFEKCERALEIRESLLPSDHPETLESVQTLGETLLHRGEFSTAKIMLQRAIVGREKSLGPLHTDTLESLSDITITLLELNDLESAETTGRKALEGRQQILGTDHPDYLVSLNIMAIWHQLKGEYPLALEVTERVLRDRERLLGPDCPDTLVTLNNLACLNFRMGFHDSASQMLHRVLVGEQSSLAKNAYDIQVSLSNKAAVLVAQKRFPEAERDLRNVLQMRESTLGVSHASTLFTMEALAHVLEARDDTEAALNLNARINQASNERQWLPEISTLLRAGLLFD